MKFKAICTDIDGTLLDSRRELSSKTIDVLQRVKDEVPVILASSRMPSAMRHLQQELGITENALVCFNGAYVIQDDGNGLHVFEDVSIGQEVASEIVKLADELTLHVSVFSADRWVTPQFDSWAEREQRITKVSPLLSGLSETLQQWGADSAPVHKVMCMGAEKDLDKLELFLKVKSFPVTGYRSKSTYLEIAPQSISKSKALATVLKKYGLQLSEVVAFGDNYNDIELLASAGCGIAVGNARDEVKTVAKKVTLANVDDGVAVAIENLFF